MKAPNSAGLICIGSAPSVGELLLQLRRSPGPPQSPCSACRRSACGVPAGATMPPSWRLRSRAAGFGDGRNVGQRRSARLAAPTPSARSLPDRTCGVAVGSGGEHHLGVAADHVDHGRAAALERHVQEVDAGRQLEQLAAEMHEAADAGRTRIALCPAASWRARSAPSRFDRQVRIDRRARSADDASIAIGAKDLIGS